MLFALGSNGSGQLGLSHDEDTSTPTAVASLDHDRTRRIKQIAAGGNHTLILYEDGSLVATGYGSDSRCGLAGKQGLVRPLPMLIRPAITYELTAKILQVSATWSASFLLCADGRTVLACGTGKSGELGLGAGVLSVPSAQNIPDFPPAGMGVIHLSSCMAHTIAVLSNGQVYGWGKGRKGQLGLPLADAWSPRLIQGLPFTATKAACGKDFTCITGEPARNELLVLGPGSRDRFGIQASVPAAIAGWKNVVASWGSIYIHMHNGDVLSWGRNDHGQLCPAGLPAIAAIAAGSEHAVALTSEGRVLAWGWGEHGNCGEPSDDRGDVNGHWNELLIPHKASAIFAGCATTFVVSEREESNLSTTSQR